MKKKKLLFVCTANLQRSPTAESLFDGNEKYEVKSVGINGLSPKKITVHSMKWADIIFCMEEIHKDYILKKFPEFKKKKIVILDIQDTYFRNDLRLIGILTEKLDKYLR
ncbi:phosphotyrosine protein phosphatase [Candidatus Pacearchaeota archaeon]|nr:phosphotyrosine protein phosphatase [Candidatus Pacearchaeota archaeon]